MKIQTHFTYEGVKCIQQLNNPLTSMEFFMLKLKEKKKKGVSKRCTKIGNWPIQSALILN